jgi:mRNA interferase MazF
MNVHRGDVVLAWYPFASGRGGKRRPCVVVLNDPDNRKIGNTIVAQITSNLQRLGDKSHVLIEIAAPDGPQTGLLHDSLVSCNNLATIEKTLIDRVVGSLSPRQQRLVNDGLKARSSCRSVSSAQGSMGFSRTARRSITATPGLVLGVTIRV